MAGRGVVAVSGGPIADGIAGRGALPRKSHRYYETAVEGKLVLVCDVERWSMITVNDRSYETPRCALQSASIKGPSL